MCAGVCQKSNGALVAARKMTPVGFEPTQLALVELESTPIRPLGQSVVCPCFTGMDLATLLSVNLTTKRFQNGCAKPRTSFVGESMLQLLVPAPSPRKLLRDLSSMRSRRCQLRYRRQGRHSVLADSNQRAPTPSITDDRRSLSKATGILFACINERREPEK